MVEDNRLGFLPEAISGLVESGGVVLGEVVTGSISLAQSWLLALNLLNAVFIF